jgi:putative ABC transport system permease protein
VKLGRTLAVSSEILLGHKVRTALSCSAIFVGVCAVVLMIGTGQAARKDLLSRIQSMGTNVLVAQAGLFQAFGTHQQQVATFTTLTPRDAEQIKQDVRGARRVSGFVQDSRVVAYRGDKFYATVCAVSPVYFRIENLRLARGRFFTEDEARGLARLAVLDPALSKDLFGWRNPLGRTIRVGGVLFKVIGVTGRAGDETQGEGPAESLYIPLETGLVRVLNVDYLNSIYVQAAEGARLEPVMGDVAALLRRTHKLPAGKPNDFTIQDPVALLKTEHDTGQAFEALVTAVAAISLFTGGIGILAVMLMAVRERVNEIGLRRALGARRRDIGLQFLLESGILSALGGVPGAAIGFFGNALVCRLAGWPLVWPWAATLGAFVFSVAVGVVFGFFPAVRAARLDPAECLRRAV